LDVNFCERYLSGALKPPIFPRYIPKYSNLKNGVNFPSISYRGLLQKMPY